MDINKSRWISKLLRHQPEDLNIDKNGWCLVSDLLAKLDITQEQLDIEVATNNKKRFAYSEDKLRIRASQGHSIPVDVELKQCTPPLKLYHGTSIQFVDSIRKSGLIKGKRLHVHLSKDIETAKAVGSRKGKYHIFEINALHMRADGHKFYISENQVYLVDAVPAKYLKDI